MVNFNELLVVDSMTIYAWEYFVARKSGYKHGAKVIMHASPVCIDPFTGEPMKGSDKKPVINKALVINVPFYTTDEQAEILLALGREHGTVVCDHENCKGFMISGDVIPADYRFAFTNMGAKVVSERYEFGTRMFKVRKDRDGRIVSVVREGGKTVIAESILLVYWEGSFVETMKQLSRNEVLRQELRNWQPVPADDEDDAKDDDDDEDDVEA